jgi:tetratricopeptide (TPR) repeat protein
MVHLDSGDLTNAQHYAEEALELSQKNGEKWVEGISWLSLGKILRKAGSSKSGKAEAYILKGINILNELKIIPFASLGYLFLGELYADTEQQDKALENSKKAERAFQEMGMDYWVTKTQKVQERFQA